MERAALHIGEQQRKLTKKLKATRADQDKRERAIHAREVQLEAGLSEIGKSWDEQTQRMRANIG